MPGAWVSLGSVLAAAAVLLLRWGWGGRQREPLLLGVAWAMLLIGVVSGAEGHGAWGVALVALAGMLSAFACLSVAGLRAPANKARPLRHHEPPAHRAPLQVGRRVLTFVLTVPLALVASLLLALAARLLMAKSGGAEADANVAALFLTPTLWGVLAFLLMMASRRGQIVLLAVPTVLGGLCLLWPGAS